MMADSATSLNTALGKRECRLGRRQAHSLLLGITSRSNGELLDLLLENGCSAANKRISRPNRINDPSFVYAQAWLASETGDLVNEAYPTSGTFKSPRNRATSVDNETSASRAKAELNPNR